MHDPKLVEALARLLKEVEDPLGSWEDMADYVRDTYLNDARAFLTEHRLVQLPERPSGWVSPENAALIHNSDDAETVVIDRHPGGNLPVYIFPGDPQEVEP